MTKKLEGKIALITGAAQGIGGATALALAQEGADVIVSDIDQSLLDELVEELNKTGVRALSVVADARKEKDIKRLKKEALTTFERIDILDNNLGIAKYAPLDNITIEEYDWMMDTNMRSAFLCTKAFLPGMLERGEGWIVFIASVSGLLGLPGEQVYCASKHAVVGFAKAIDHEVFKHGIKVSVIAPGAVNTKHAFDTGRTPGDPKLEEFLEPEDVAEAVIFAVTQPLKSRIFLIGMRPMCESLFD